MGGCQNECCSAPAVLNQISSGILEDHEIKMTVYEARRLNDKLFSIIFVTNTFIEIGTIIEFNNYVSFVVNSENYKIKVFLMHKEDFEICVNEQYVLKAQTVRFPAILKDSIIVVHEIAIPLGIYLNMISSAKNKFIVTCHSASNIIYYNILQELEATIICTHECGGESAISSLSFEGVVESEEAKSKRDIYVIGPLWLLKTVELLSHLFSFQAYGLLNLYGEAAKKEYRWINLTYECLAGESEFDEDEQKYYEQLSACGQGLSRELGQEKQGQRRVPV